MFKVTLIAVGKIKNKSVGVLLADYFKRLQPFAKVALVELPALAFGADNHDKIKNEEGKNISTYLKKHNFDEVWLAEESGKILSSLELSSLLDKTPGHIAIVIGGALGLADDLKKQNFFHWSLSRLTLPHEMARLIIAEQLYRAATLERGLTYHY